MANRNSTVRSLPVCQLKATVAVELGLTPRLAPFSCTLGGAGLQAGPPLIGGHINGKADI